MPQKTEKFIKAIYNSLNNNTGSEKILMLHSTLSSMFLFLKCKRHNWHGEITGKLNIKIKFAAKTLPWLSQGNLVKEAGWLTN